ncbi:response regulator [Undibacterium sp. RTI2.1]|uniref:response regulator n=1 Tax=unclassified Undibacterium TaxID=2630295 RepID=UPI002B23288A|nr:MULTISPECIES: response regulator [unclassified Undibacterium]MEB0033200.1 response regulator [Undibacterium sp. RTI2.1]MEB0118995.1 response regulator [Undibacterium sp. RTI2.2]
MIRSGAYRPGTSLNVLVVDDDYFMQRVAIILLDSLGHSGVVVDDGKKALECLAQRRFDLVLLDIMMPVMDGLEALATIRTKEQHMGSHLPIIMVTGHAEPTDQIRLKQAGADGYVTKPIDITKLQTEIDRVMLQS